MTLRAWYTQNGKYLKASMVYVNVVKKEDKHIVTLSRSEHISITDALDIFGDFELIEFEPTLAGRDKATLRFVVQKEG